MQPKAEARSQALSRRATLSATDREAAGAALASALAPLLADARRIAAYAAIGTEPPTAALLALRPDLLLPVLLADDDLDWAPAGDLRPTERGLLEPTGPALGVDAISTCDVVIVPALAVDRRGVRLGRGGGSYDRALARATGLTVALLYDGETVDALPAEEHDVPVGAVAMPSTGMVRVPW
jgi:5-formyltetrahydrofolate cyclo-ligase